MTAMRKIGFGLAACALLAAGCAGRNRTPVLPPLPVAKDLDLGDVEKQLRLTQMRLVSLKLDATARFVSPTVSATDICRAKIIFLRHASGNKLRLMVRKPTGGRLIDAGCDGEQIWVYEPTKSLAQRGRANAYYDPEGSLGIFPDDLAEIFALWSVFETRLRIFEVSFPAYHIQLIDVGKSENIQLLRRIAIQRSDLSVVGYQIFNPDNSLRAVFWMGEHKNHQGVSVPHRIRVAWPAARSILDMQVNYVEVNVPIEADAFLMPAGKKVTVAELTGSELLPRGRRR